MTTAERQTVTPLDFDSYMEWRRRKKPCPTHDDRAVCFLCSDLRPWWAEARAKYLAGVRG